MKYKHKNITDSYVAVTDKNRKRIEISPGEEFVLEDKILNGCGIICLSEIKEEKTTVVRRQPKKITSEDELNGSTR